MTFSKFLGITLTNDKDFLKRPYFVSRSQLSRTGSKNNHARPLMQPSWHVNDTPAIKVCCLLFRNPLKHIVIGLESLQQLSQHLPHCLPPHPVSRSRRFLSERAWKGFLATSSTCEVGNLAEHATVPPINRVHFHLVSWELCTGKLRWFEAG